MSCPGWPGVVTGWTDWGRDTHELHWLTIQQKTPDLQEKFPREQDARTHTYSHIWGEMAGGNRRQHNQKIKISLCFYARWLNGSIVVIALGQFDVLLMDSTRLDADADIDMDIDIDMDMDGRGWLN